MTSPIIPESTQQDLEGRSVRDVVAHSPGQVNDAWCRKVLHKILRSLELQYTMQMPHRAITPDTVVFHANGEPLLISDDIDAAPALEAQLDGDLAALAGVIHYAITHELTPARPLAGRADGYSAALVATVDACMDLDPVRRPGSVEAVRSLLDSAAAPSPTAAASALPHVPVAAPAAFAIPPAATPAPHHAGGRGGRRWAYAAGGGAVAVAAALVLFASWRDGGPEDHIAVTQPKPQTGDRGHPGASMQAGPASVETVAAEARKEQVAVSAQEELAGAGAGGTATPTAGDLTASAASDPVGSAASGASSGGATGSGGGVEQPGRVSRAAGEVKATVPPAPSARAAAAKEGKKAKSDRAVAPGAVPGNAIYQLQIKPWGTVYVDGVERGASPPMKRLALTPGPHTIRITHPKHRDSILEFESAQTTSNGKIIVDFNQEIQ
ncbi:MAG TPA: hypothetical protein VF663_09750 [Telluria sp.]